MILDPQSPSTPLARPAPRRSLGELFAELTRQLSLLVRQEGALARRELLRAGRRAGLDATLLALATGVLGLGVLVLVAALVVGLGLLLDAYWLSALIVGVVLAGAGGALAWREWGDLRAVHLLPRQALASARATGAWAAARVEGARGRLLPRAHHGGAEAARPASSRSTAGGARAASARHDPGEPGEGKQRDEEPQGGLVKRTLKESMQDDVIGQGAKVAFYAFLSMPPGLLVLFSLVGYFGGDSTAAWLRRQMQLALPQSAYGIIESFISQVVNQRSAAPLSFGLLLSIWAASNVFMGLGDALNKAYDVQEPRAWWKRRLIAIGVMVAFALLFLAGSAALLAGPQISSGLGLGGAIGALWNVLFWPLAFVLVVAAFWTAYYVLPDRDQSGQRVTLLEAAAIAALLWVAATAAFRLYIANFGSYTSTYGFLGAFIVLLMWMYISAIVVLVGGEIASEMERS